MCALQRALMTHSMLQAVSMLVMGNNTSTLEWPNII